MDNIKLNKKIIVTGKLTLKPVFISVAPTRLLASVVPTASWYAIPLPTCLIYLAVLSRARCARSLRCVMQL